MSVDIAKSDFAKCNITFGVSNGNVAEVKDVKCPVENGEITIRVYSPDGVTVDSKVPAYINFHGGGWTFGRLYRGYFL
jgi:acetyl esterase